MANPYSSKPSSSFWRTAVAAVPPFALDPMLRPPFRIDRSDRIATAGSCFAQNIARSLRAHGFSYYVAEQPDPDHPLDPAAAALANYGTFSARYGNVYTVRQLVQLFDRAHGLYQPDVPAWPGKAGAVLDPFRPLVQPGGFPSLQALEHDRARHLDAVRTMFANLSVFVFTLGLTEGWQHDETGAALPLAPGVAGSAGPAGYSFSNHTTASVLADLRAFHRRLLSVNPAARLILTVSPVPLVATFLDRHVLVSTAYSKSALHAAAVEAADTLPGVSYFPSYEIVTAPISRDRYFDGDLRTVNRQGVDHVMRVFFRHYAGAGGQDATTPTGTFVDDFRSDTRQAQSIVCDEDAITAANREAAAA